MDAPVSVIIPCYCCGETIERTLESVAQQTYLPSEVLLIEDGSPDDTLTVLKHLKNQYPKHWLKIIPLGQNKGVSTARNTGWDQATQPYIAFLDAGDLWHPRKIELQYQWLQYHPDVLGCGHSRQLMTNNHFDWSSLDDNFSYRIISAREILLTNPLITSSLMMFRTLPSRFDPAWSYCEDHHLLIRLILANYPFAYLDISALLYDDLTPGLSANRWRMRKSQLKIYWQLWKKHKINFLTYIVCSGYSLIKFFIYTFAPKLHFLMSRTTLKRGLQKT